MKFCGCVVIYNPEIDVLSNINSYINQLDILYVLDNSDDKNKKIVAKISQNNKCKYIDMNGNKGVACALNRAVKIAIKSGYKWMLTMDQDSRFPSQNLVAMKDYIAKEVESDVAVVGGRFIAHGDRRKTYHNEISYMHELITSGSAINLYIAKKIGGFMSQLFIDAVDREYCFRAIVNGYKNIRLNNVLFEHSIGNQKKVKGKITYNYSPIRYYYLIRNENYVIKKYASYPILTGTCEFRKKFISVWIESVRYEKDRLKKYAFMLLGYIHYKFGFMGKLKL